MSNSSDQPSKCPDGGTCHHLCDEQPAVYCFRTQTCEPLSDIYPDDQWPTEIILAYSGEWVDKPTEDGCQA